MKFVLTIDQRLEKREERLSGELSSLLSLRSSAVAPLYASLAATGRTEAQVRARLARAELSSEADAVVTWLLGLGYLDDAAYARAAGIRAGQSTLERYQKALDEDASVMPNRKVRSMTWRTEIRTPGLPPNTRRLGDLRLECQVGMEAGLISNTLPVIGLVAELIQGMQDFCNGSDVPYLFFSDRPLFSVAMVAGARREILSVDDLYAGVSHGRISKADLAYCDCQVLLDRTGGLGADHVLIAAGGDSNGPAEMAARLALYENSEHTRKMAHELAEKVRRRALVIIFSDFFCDSQELLSCFQHLRFQKHDLAVFHLLDRMEVDFKFDRPVRFTDLESSFHLVAESRVEQIVKKYAEEAGVQATPHTFRHQAITWLTRHSGMADAELQLITGHARRETLAVYQHVALDGDLEKKYQESMKAVEL